MSYDKPGRHFELKTEKVLGSLACEVHTLHATFTIPK